MGGDPDPRAGELRRGLGTLDVALLVAGIIIGAGVFSTPGVVASHLDSPIWILAAWGVGGLIALSGALIYAELGSAFPRAGGDYVYLREGLGQAPAFLYGWLFFTVSGTGSIAALAVAAGGYAAELHPALPARLVAPALVIALTAINAVGLRAGATVQNVLTAIKLLALAAVVVLAWNASGGTPTPPPAHVPEPTRIAPMWGLALALVPICFTYMGWNAAGYVGGEVRRPENTLPRGLLLGTVLVTAVYLVVNGAFLRALTPAAMAGDMQVAASACRGALGPRTAAVVAALVLVSIVGGMNGMVLAHARVLYAMSRGGHFLSVFGRVHPRTRTPLFALLLQGLWSLGLIWTGTFERLVGYVTFVMVAMSCLVVFGAIRLRLRGVAAPFRAPAFPVAAVGFLVAATWILVGVVRFAPVNAAVGVVMLALGSVVYVVWRR